MLVTTVPNQTESTHAHGLQVGVPEQQSILASPSSFSQVDDYLLVISKVVPKIWALTNSAMVNAPEGAHLSSQEARPDEQKLEVEAVERSGRSNLASRAAAGAIKVTDIVGDSGD